MSLSKEELEELAALEAEETKRREDEVTEAKRQHLAALRMQKRLEAAHGKPGLDFVVVETRVGNFAMRRPQDVELEMLTDKKDDPAAHEEFCGMLSIEPSSSEVKATIGKYVGLPNALIPAIMSMVDMARSEEVKK